jgi:MFS family permease
LWRNRDFAILWSGQVVSTLGVSISSTAMPLLVPALTGSPARAGLVGAAGTLPFLPAGPLVDRWDRRRIMLVSQIVAVMLVAAVAATASRAVRHAPPLPGPDRVAA